MTRFLNIKSFIESATLDELLELEVALSNEIRSRRKEPGETNRVVTYSDGASRGNPGLSGCGILLYNGNDVKITEEFQFLGLGTNNEAEYRALLLALEKASQLTTETVDCFMDSELLVKQLNGQYAVKSHKLGILNEEVQRWIKKFSKVTFTHVPREHPKLQLADQLANRAIDEALKQNSGLKDK